MMNGADGVEDDVRHHTKLKTSSKPVLNGGIELASLWFARCLYLFLFVVFPLIWSKVWFVLTKRGLLDVKHEANTHTHKSNF